MDKADVRRQRLKQLIKNESSGVVSRFCDKHGLNPVFIRQLLNPKKDKSFGEKAAQKIEEIIGLPSGYLSGTQVDPGTDIMQQLEVLLHEAPFLTDEERAVHITLLKAHKKAKTEN